MAYATNVYTYEDVRRVLDAALRAGGAIFRVDSPKAAIRWRGRAYFYRSLLRKLEAEKQDIPGFVPRTPYDELRLTADGSTVRIELIAPEGTLETLDGKELDTSLPVLEDELVAETEDDMLRAAKALLEKQ